MPYRSLNPDKIIATATKLEARVATRFPESGLRLVAVELVVLSGDIARAAHKLEGPIWSLRLLLLGVVICGALTFAYVGTFLSFDRLTGIALRSVESIEAVINTAILAGLGLTALIKTEARIKRDRVIGHLHSLRSIVHVIDMHQLTKDPVVLLAGYQRTAASPERLLTPAELTRYLDYCSEMISITGKLAALFSQSVTDEGVIEAVNDIEMLGSTLSRKVWQKIMLLESRLPDM
ncbi:hypothetical protein [Flavimaricola marinus]|uniref:Uncharacterized protein n=1 Tax=Flavimaricola marinus TaxID=1819565 RepID=A0A238LGH6_9RHOB|nr:hypothetical protein [Flavimaricola marinus]SMY08000.1 hypothetical protein LOM8899_02146 [Flavimaricola marinus]